MSEESKSCVMYTLQHKITKARTITAPFLSTLLVYVFYAGYIEQIDDDENVFRHPDDPEGVYNYKIIMERV